MDAQSHSIGDAVAHFQELEGERSQGQRLGARDLVERHLALQPVLTQLGVHQAECQLSAVDRGVHFLQQIGQGAHVVLVPVGEDDAEHPLLVLHEVRVVGQDEVDAQHVVIGEHQAGVDHEQGFAILQDHHVLADGPQSPEGDDFERLFSHVANRCLRYARWRL